MKLIVSPYYGEDLIFCFLFHYLLNQCGNQHFDVLLSRTRLVLFLPKYGKDAACEGRKGWKGVHLPPESASFVFLVNLIKILFPICTLTWSVNNYVSRQAKGIDRKNQRYFFVTKTVDHCTSLIKKICSTQLTVID